MRRGGRDKSADERGAHYLAKAEMLREKNDDSSSGESRDPGLQHHEKNWAPAFAGATAFVALICIMYILLCRR